MVEPEVRSGARLIRIVEMMAIKRRPLTAGEIGTELQIPLTSVHRIMSTLVKLRWAERQPGRLYALGPGLLGVSGLALGRSALVQLAKPVLGHVAELSGLQSHLAVLAGHSVTYVARETGIDGDTTQFKLGAAQPIHCTSAGKLLFAFLPDMEKAQLLQTGSFPSFTPLTIVDPEELRTELEEIRTNRYSVDRGEFSDFWRSLSVPVSRPDGGAVAAITCGGRPDRMTVEHQGWIRQEMSVLAEELSSQLA